jgi:hypothetical protein
LRRCYVTVGQIGQSKFSPEHGKSISGSGLSATRLNGRSSISIQIVIEMDDSNKPLVDALLQAGIPRSKIILAYAGEPVPESA